MTRFTGVGIWCSNPEELAVCVFDLTATVQGHELRFPQTLDRDAHVDRGVVASRQKHHLIIEESPMYEWVDATGS